MLKHKKHTRILSSAIAVLVLAAIFSLFAFSVLGNAQEGTGSGNGQKINVWLIGGQSNAVGYGNEVPAEAADDYRYYNGFNNTLYWGVHENPSYNPDEFVTLTLGKGQTNVRNGAELGVAKALDSTGEMNAVIKCAWGATALLPKLTDTISTKVGTWTSPSYVERANMPATDPNYEELGTYTPWGSETAIDIPDVDTSVTISNNEYGYAGKTNAGNMYELFVATVAEGVAKLVEMGYTPVLRGMWWMQGEAESNNATWSSLYDEALECLINDIRAEMNTAFGETQGTDMPFVCGNIYRNEKKNADGSYAYTQQAYLAEINDAQAMVAEKLDYVYVLENGDDDEGLAEGEAVVSKDGYIDQPFFAQQDGWHFNSATQQYFGEKFVELALSATNEYVVTVDGQGATFTGGGIYKPGDTVTITVTPEENFTVNSLSASIGGADATEVTLTNSSYTFTVVEANVAFRINAEYTGDPLTTEYGEIPAEYMDSSIYPFILFEDGVANGKGYTGFGEALYAIPEANAKAYTILMRNNYTTRATDKAGASKVDLFDETITVDLNGYSLTRGTDSYIFDTYNEGKTAYDTTVTVKNGNIVTIANKPIIGLNYGKASAGMSNTTYNFNFDNVNFLNKSAILTMGMVSECWEDGKDTSGAGVNANLVFNNCTFDMGNIANPVIMNFTGGVTNTVVSAAFNGGKIIAKNNTFTLAKTDAKDTVVMGAYNGSYTTLTLPEGTAAPATLYNNANGVVLSYSASEGVVSDGSVTYDLVEQPLFIEGYGTITEEFKTSTFAIFNKQGFVTGADTWGDAVKAAKAESEGQSGNRWVAIYLRENYTTVATVDANTDSFRHIIGTIVVDLGGNTLTRDGATIFDIYAIGTSAKNPTRYEIKNGTLATTKSQIMAFDVHSSVNESTGKKTIEMEITDVTYKATGTLNQPLAFTVWNNDNTSVGLDLYVTYNDCVFDMTNGNGKHLFYSFDTTPKTSTRTGFVNANVVINGGQIINMGNSWFAYIDSYDHYAINASENGYLTVKMATGTKPYDGGGSSNGKISTFSSSNGDKLQLTNCTAGDVYDTYSFKVSEKTPYGYIPFDEYGTETDKPFVVFQKTGENAYTYKASYTTWIDAITAGKNRVNDSSYKEAVVFARRDYASVTADGTNSNKVYDYVNGHLIIDLNGYTVTRSAKNIFDISFRSGTVSNKSSITVKNGTLKSSGAHLIGIGIASNAADKVFDFTFENVTFSAPSTGTSKGIGLVYNVWTNTNAYVGGTINMTFNDCTFDMAGLAASKNNALFVADDVAQGSKAKINANNVINGGQMINYKADVAIARLDADDTLAFSNATGSYTKAVASAYPAYSIILPGKNGTELTFVETATAGTYVLAPSTVTKYGNIPARYENYLFVAFGENKNFIGADDTFLDTVSSYDNEGIVHAAKNYLSGNTWNGTSFGANPRSAVILVRGDYKMTSNESYNNLAQVQGVLLVDLDGHTITAPSNRVMFPATIKPWTVTGDSPIYPSEFQIVNGTIEIVNSALISFTPWNANAEVDVKNKAFTFLFENVDFSVIGTANAIFTKFGIDSKTPDATAYPELTLNNCTVDVSNAVNNAVIFDLGNGLTHAKVTVNGGEIIAGSNSFILYAKNKNTETDIFFGKSDGAYTTITVPSGTALPIKTVNGGALAFVKTAEDGTTATYSLAAYDLSSFTPKTSITLGSELVYNIYIPVTENLKSYTVDGATVSDAETVTLDDGNEYYHVTVKLPSSVAARNIVLRAVITVGEKDYAGTWTMSIPKYAKKILASDATDVEQDLVCDVLAYIKAAYIYFDATDSDEVSALIDEILNGYGKEFEKLDGTNDTDEGLYGVIIALEEKPAIRFVLPEGKTAENYTFTMGGAALPFTTGTVTLNGVTYTYAEVSLYAYQMTRDITYSDGTVSGSYNFASYYDFVTTDEELKDDAELIALVEKFYNYVASAEAYRASVSK